MTLFLSQKGVKENHRALCNDSLYKTLLCIPETNLDSEQLIEIENNAFAIPSNDDDDGNESNQEITSYINPSDLSRVNTSNQIFAVYCCLTKS